MSAFAVFATSLNLLVGYAGMVSFGHGLFYGLGAYSFALMMQKVGTSMPMAFRLTIVLSALVAVVIGAICIRLKEIYFSFLTLAFQMLLHSIIIAWTDVTGGDQGLTGGVPRPPFSASGSDDPQHLYVFCCCRADRFAVPHVASGAVAVRLHAAHDPRQSAPRRVPRHPGLAHAACWRSSSPACSVALAACS